MIQPSDIDTTWQPLRTAQSMPASAQPAIPPPALLRTLPT